jgi:hypothetical protein
MQEQVSDPVPWVPAAIPRPARMGPDGLEVSVSAGPGRPGGSLRATFDYCNDGADFPARLAAALAAGRAALAALADPPDPMTATAFDRLADAAYPAPERVDARTHFAGWVGCSVDSQAPDVLSSVKMYVNLQAPAGAGTDGVVAKWPELAAALAVIGTDGLAEPRMAGVQIGGGRLSGRVYARARPTRSHELVAGVARRAGLDTGSVLADIQDSGFGRALWTDDVVVKVEAGRDGTPSDLAIHLSATALGSPADAWSGATGALSRAAADGSRAGALLDLAGVDPAAWTVASLGLGYRLDTATLDRVNLYAQPGPG